LPAETISAAASEPNVHKERSRHKTPTCPVAVFPIAVFVDPLLVDK